MVTEVTLERPEVENSEKAVSTITSGWSRWKLVQRFQTLEAALVLMKQLEAGGQQPQLVMDDGLSVVTQRR